MNHEPECPYAAANNPEFLGHHPDLCWACGIARAAYKRGLKEGAKA